MCSNKKTTFENYDLKFSSMLALMTTHIFKGRSPGLMLCLHLHAPSWWLQKALSWKCLWPRVDHNLLYPWIPFITLCPLHVSIKTQRLSSGWWWKLPQLCIVLRSFRVSLGSRRKTVIECKIIGPPAMVPMCLSISPELWSP